MEYIKIATNKKAFRDYEILETLEAGIELAGSEVKSLRQLKANLNDSFARIDKNQVFLYNLHISPYKEASYLNVEPTRVRRLLLHRAQIRKLLEKTSQRGSTLVPLKIYFNDRGFVKVEVALCRGKKLYDRREDIKRREDERKMKRALSNKRKMG
jgi:SsrA-binding protein